MRDVKTGLGLLALLIVTLAGCAPADRPEAAGVPADMIVAGRFESSEEMDVLRPMGSELSHIAEAWRLFTFRPSGEGAAPLRFAGSGRLCPPDPIDRRIYVVALRRSAPFSRLEIRSRGKRVGPRGGVVATLEMIACAPIDAETSEGFIAR
jgi:hypothetical protein